MKPVIISPRAYADVRRLEAWLVERDARAAEPVGPLLFDAMHALSEFPDRGREVSSGGGAS